MARPTTPKLSSQRIAAAALELVDKQGEFTVPQLAKALGVTASSLYNHVQGKEEIVELMRGQAMSAISLPDEPSAHWTDTVRRIATAYWQSYSQHPKLIPLFTSHTVRDSTTLRVYDALAETLAGAGFPATERLHVITLIDSFVLGSALDAGAPVEVWSADQQTSPAFAEALTSGQPTADRARQAFEMGLDVLIDGLAARISAAVRSAD